MKKLFSLFFAVALMFSVVFISEAISSNSPFSAQAQVTVKRKNRGLASRTYRGGRYVGRKTVQGAKYVGRKTVKGTKSVFRKTKNVVTGN